MKGFATILRATKIKQIKEDLIRYDKKGKLVGKCALGVISCEVGLKLDKDRTNVSSMAILMAGGLTQEESMEQYPFTRFKNCYAKLPNEPELYDEQESSLDGMIFHLNDGIGMSFKEIADFLEVTFPEEEWSK